MQLFSASTPRLFWFQSLTVLISAIGIFYFDVNIENILLILLGYFLYSGIGISMTFHRFWSHQSFQFKNNVVKWVFTWLGLMAGRGSVIGWVHTHRQHHKFSDTENDPHSPNIVGYKVFFPIILNYSEKIDKKIVKDLICRLHVNINKFYFLLIFAWGIFLFLISPSLFYFFWIVPIALTHLMLISFIYFGHKFGYTNYSCRDDSKNNKFFGYLLWGEGWHNNHHYDSKKYSFKVKWWEFDPMSILIRAVKT